jgi:hypothetical protein
MAVGTLRRGRVHIYFSIRQARRGGRFVRWPLGEERRRKDRDGYQPGDHFSILYRTSRKPCVAGDNHLMAINIFG